jgi:HSP20 family protein
MESPMWRTLVCGESSERSAYRWEPPTNVYETESGGLVHVEIAGLERHDFSITFANGLLCISGQRSLKAAPSVVALHRMEIATGSFRTEVPVPWDVDADLITVEYRRGLLVITLPQPSMASPEEI